MTRTVELLVRAFDQTGARELVGPFTIEPPANDEFSAAHAVEAASAAIGRPVALLGQDGPDVVCFEVLSTTGLRWVDAALPEGWRQRAPWRQPGWYSATVDRIDAALEAAGVRRTGDVVQTKHWSISALIRVPTDAGDVWFKQVPPMFAHEGRLNAWLAELSPEMVPPIAVGDDWWIGQTMAPEQPVPPGRELGAIEVLHRLQVLSVDRSDELIALGCPDRRLPSLLPAVEAVVVRDDLFSGDVRDQLYPLLGQLAASIERLTACGLPDTVVHGDFHRGNTRFTSRGWVIYDWTDGCLSHPLVDLAPASLRPDSRAARLAETARLWRQLAPGLPDDAGWHGLVVGAAHQVVTYQRIADGVEASATRMWAEEGDRCAQALVTLLTLDRDQAL